LVDVRVRAGRSSDVIARIGIDVTAGVYVSPGHSLDGPALDVTACAYTRSNVYAYTRSRAYTGPDAYTRSEVHAHALCEGDGRSRSHQDKR
jgi:hypothetical protein